MFDRNLRRRGFWAFVGFTAVFVGSLMTVLTSRMIRFFIIGLMLYSLFTLHQKIDALARQVKELHSPQEMASDRCS